MRTIRGFFEFPIIVGLIALAVVLFHICTTEAKDHGCPEVISTQEACSIHVDEVDGAHRLEITANPGYDEKRLNLRYGGSAVGNSASVYITPADGHLGCKDVKKLDENGNPSELHESAINNGVMIKDRSHCTAPKGWDSLTPNIDWGREASNFRAWWYEEGGDLIVTREYFICDNHDCGEPAEDDRTPPVNHRDRVEPQPTQTDPAPTPVTTPTVKVNETAPKPTVTYTEVPNPDYAALLKKLEQLKFDIAALEADIASTPRTISVRVDQVVDEPASTVESEPEEVHLWVWTESDLDTSYDPPKITPERIRAWRNSGSTEQCFDQSYLQHFDKKYSVHQHACKD